MLGWNGICGGPMQAFAGVRLPLLRLQAEQEATTLTQVVCPPRERGSKWSNVRSSRVPQNWHTNLSRRNTLNRVKAGWVEGRTEGFSETRLGGFTSMLGLCTALS